MSKAIYQQLAEYLTQGPVALAIVVDAQGSVPREVGAKMLIGPDGTTVDTIGGGAGEAKVIATALRVLADGQPQMVTIDLSGAAQRSPEKIVEGVCGGWMRVWVERWQPEQRDWVKELIARLDHSGAYLVVPFGPQPAYFTEHPPDLEIQPASYVERLRPPPLLLIVGAGHVGLALAQLANWLGFTLAVQDDRPEFANGDRFPEAAYLWNGPVSELLTQLPAAPDLYIALVTRGFTYDLAALEAILAANIDYRYLGMIGSRQRVGKVTKALAVQEIQNFHAPIGLAISALTPEEIAVSIGAQLIQIRRAAAPDLTYR